MSYYFVGGSQRSGTTLLATVLCSGKESNDYFGESASLRSIIELYRSLGAKFDTDVKFHFGNQAILDEYFAGTVKSFLSHTMAVHSPASSLVLKEPHLTCYFPQLHKLVPRSRFILIKRDPRDIVVSMLKVGEKLAADGKKHLFNSGDIGKIARTILPFYAPTINASKKNRGFRSACHWVEYESLTRNPEAVVEELRKFTGLKLEDADFENPTRHVQEERRKIRVENKNISAWVTDLTDKGSISDESVGRFKSHLSDEQIATVEEVLGQLMQVLGYEKISA